MVTLRQLKDYWTEEQEVRGLNPGHKFFNPFKSGNELKGEEQEQLKELIGLWPLAANNNPQIAHWLDRGGILVVRALAYCSKDPSSNHAGN